VSVGMGVDQNLVNPGSETGEQCIFSENWGEVSDEEGGRGTKTGKSRLAGFPRKKGETGPQGERGYCRGRQLKLKRRVEQKGKILWERRRKRYCRCYLIETDRVRNDAILWHNQWGLGKGTPQGKCGGGLQRASSLAWHTWGL